MDKKTLYILISLFVVFVLAVIVKAVFLSPNGGFDGNGGPPVNGSDSQGYIKLPSTPNELKKYTGRVISTDSSDGVEVDFKLLNEDGSLIIFLTADDDKLMLAESRVVEVSGEVMAGESGAYNLLNVKSISFK